jgi:hypothetical protein
MRPPDEVQLERGDLVCGARQSGDEISLFPCVCVGFSPRDCSPTEQSLGVVRVSPSGVFRGDEMWV